MSLAVTMPTDLPTAPAARRARSPRATNRPDAKLATRARKVSFYLSPEAIRRLGIAATMGDTDKSRILELVIAEAPSLKRWVISDRAKGSPEVEISSD